MAVLLILQANGQKMNKEEMTLKIDSLNEANQNLSAQLDSVNKEKELYFGMYEVVKEKVIKNDFKMVDRHHFTPQTTEAFRKEKLLHSKDIKCFDIENIDYNYISSLFGIVLPDDVIHKKQGHERKKFKDNT